VSYTGGDELFIGRDYHSTKGYSEKVAATIDDEVKLLIDRAYEHCSEILKRDREKLQQVVDFLMEHETMSGSQFVACMEGRQIGQAEENAMFTNVQNPESADQE
jgi:cell division protease FtsH